MTVSPAGSALRAARAKYVRYVRGTHVRAAAGGARARRGCPVAGNRFTKGRREGVGTGKSKEDVIIEGTSARSVRRRGGSITLNSLFFFIFFNTPFSYQQNRRQCTVFKIHEEDDLMKIKLYH